MYNSAANQQPSVGIPTPFPKACIGQAIGDQYWLPFVAAAGTVYDIGDGGCAGAPPEMQTGQQDTSIVPSDTTYANTALDGTGTADFTIATDETNASLGCSQSSRHALSS